MILGKKKIQQKRSPEDFCLKDISDSLHLFHPKTRLSTEIFGLDMKIGCVLLQMPL
jgi:hypothetical protein